MSLCDRVYEKGFKFLEEYRCAKAKSIGLENELLTQHKVVL